MMRGGTISVPGATGGGEFAGAAAPPLTPAYTVNRLGRRCSVMKRNWKTTASIASLLLSTLSS